MNIKSHEVKKAIILDPLEELNKENSKFLKRTVEKYFSLGKNIILNCGGINNIGAEGLQSLHELSIYAGKRKLNFILRNPSPQLNLLFEITQSRKIFRICECGSFESCACCEMEGDGLITIRNFAKARIYDDKNSSYRMKAFRWHMMLRVSYAIKRYIDFFGALFLIIITLPIFFVVGLAIKLTSKGPIFYVQTRVGKDGQLMKFFKFRSMYIDADKRRSDLLSQNDSKDGVIFKMKNDPRITTVGRFIRKYSIDEMPQFFNVLVGTMSLVGPRPPLPSEVIQYTITERKRLHIKPGLTCLWQVSGRSDLPFHKQVMLDEQYIRSRSIFTDIIILLKTIPAIIFGKGAY